MSYTNGLDKPTDYFNTVLYTGNGSTNAITGVGFQPDWVWVKDRDTSGYNHIANDNVRGVTKYLRPNLTNAEATITDAITSFDSDGFTLGSDASNGESNRNTINYVSWNWLASNTTASNTDGSITSTVSANTTAGFSIVSYTGSGTISDTVGHGLGTTPNVVIIKNRDTGTSGWNVHHSSLSSGYNLQLQSTGAQFNSSGQGHIGTVGSSTFGFVAGSSGNDQVNDSSEKYIAYCFAEKKGYSKFGSYTGNGSTDGSFIFTGMKPSMIIVKRTDTTGNWRIYDNKRDTFNYCRAQLSPNLSNAESNDSANTDFDFLSNGFKARGGFANINASGGTYIYMAFAENPFVSSGGIPCTAR